MGDCGCMGTGAGLHMDSRVRVDADYLPGTYATGVPAWTTIRQIATERLYLIVLQ